MFGVRGLVRSSPNSESLQLIVAVYQFWAPGNFELVVLAQPSPTSTIFSGPV